VLAMRRGQRAATAPLPCRAQGTRFRGLFFAVS
jgi:hypothetical protein